MITSRYERDGVVAILSRYDRWQELKRKLYVKTLRDLYPESRYEGSDEIDVALRNTLIDSFDQFTNVLAGITALTGAPYPLPDVKDAATVNKGYQHFMTDAGQVLYAECAEMLTALMQPLTSEAERPVEHLTREQLSDPLSERSASPLPVS